MIAEGQVSSFFVFSGNDLTRHQKHNTRAKEGERERGNREKKAEKQEREETGKKRQKSKREREKSTEKKTIKTHGEKVGHVVAEGAVVSVLLDRHDLDGVVPGLFCFCFLKQNMEEGRRKREREGKRKRKVSVLVFSFLSFDLEKEKKNLKKKICPFPSFFLPYRADPRQHVASKLQVRVHLRLRRRHADVALVDAQRARPLRPRVGELVGLVRRRRDDARRGLARRLVVDAVELNLVPLLRGLVVRFFTMGF